MKAQDARDRVWAVSLKPEVVAEKAEGCGENGDDACTVDAECNVGDGDGDRDERMVGGRAGKAEKEAGKKRDGRNVIAATSIPSKRREKHTQVPRRNQGDRQPGDPVRQNVPQLVVDRKLVPPLPSGSGRAPGVGACVSTRGVFGFGVATVFAGNEAKRGKQRVFHRHLGPVVCVDVRPPRLDRSL